ncbi:MAG: hypothetical protein ACJAVE_002055 [Polaribacter sp.]|jgi:hypothetical protein|tara:strand:+ start:618 stop:848 length:231 start_codon:yes stop_codon:yes gene_type:complete
MNCDKLKGKALADCLERNKPSNKKVPCRKQGISGDALKACRKQNFKNKFNKAKTKVVQGAKDVKAVATGKKKITIN